MVNRMDKKIIRSKRKTIALQVTDDATLIIRAPFDVDDSTIEKVIIKHSRWIEKHKEEIRKRDPKFLHKEFVNGEGFLYLGRSYKLRMVDSKEPLQFDNCFYLSKDYLKDAKDVFIKWYKKQAYEKISERVKLYASIYGFRYKKINITNAMQRWGSCSNNGNLNFSWRLIMAPLRVIDYVVIHELLHTEEKSHSKKFWNRLKVLMSDYEKYDRWLKENGYLLRI